MYKPEIPDDVSKTGPRYKNYQTRKEHYHDTEEICQTRESSRGNCGGRRIPLCDSLRHQSNAPLRDLVHQGLTCDAAGVQPETKRQSPPLDNHALYRPTPPHVASHT